MAIDGIRNGRMLKIEQDPADSEVVSIERSGFRASKGARWMPWHREPMKDVDGCDKPRGVANELRSADVRMGQPLQGDTWRPTAECIGSVEVSRGTETSQYPEEKKSKETPSVVVSERGRA